ncbi:hypothetical protein FB45DRAFT_1104734 [Roridomyces roridus]|uniref:Uncharacterized protein n=1 Tax=Roridomyces roridus TaxID=1738132 RepID=A0AAD7BD47_9AGAR|nr:hypothetical protein FB45DRAFT_1104734 [Roridomyces roridus]
MPDIAIVPANFIALLLDTFLFGIVLLLFISDIYFLATQRTLAGKIRPRKHHFTSLVFICVAFLFLIITTHWALSVYQGYFALIRLGSGASAQAFYGDVSQPSQIAKTVLLLFSVLVGDSLAVDFSFVGRLAQQTRFGISDLHSYRDYSLISANMLTTVVAGVGIILEFVNAESLHVSGTAQIRGWTAIGFGASLLNNIYCTGLIAYRISTAKASPESRLMAFCDILVESAALQSFWFIFASATTLASSNSEFFATEAFPAIIGITNLLIHARVGLGCSSDTAGRPKVVTV